MNVELIIFDCDGVLVDSEVISCRAHAATLTRHGYPITDEQVLQRFLGVSDRTMRRYLRGQRDIPVSTALLLNCMIAHRLKPVVPKRSTRLDFRTHSAF